jgi:hypothetical protein
MTSTTINPNDPDPLLESNLCKESDPLQDQNKVKLKNY